VEIITGRQGCCSRCELSGSQVNAEITGQDASMERSSRFRCGFSYLQTGRIQLDALLVGGLLALEVASVISGARLQCLIVV